MIKRDRLSEMLGEWFEGSKGKMNSVADLILDEIEKSNAHSPDKASRGVSLLGWNSIGSAPKSYLPFPGIVGAAPIILGGANYEGDIIFLCMWDKHKGQWVSPENKELPIQPDVWIEIPKIAELALPLSPDSTGPAGSRLDPDQDGCAPKEVMPSSEDVHAWISRAYRDPEDRTKMNAARFTRWNMEVAFQAGFGAGYRAALTPSAPIAGPVREALAADVLHYIQSSEHGISRVPRQLLCRIEDVLRAGPPPPMRRATLLISKIAIDRRNSLI